MKLTEGEVSDLLCETRSQITMADVPLDEFRVGDTVQVTIGGRFLTDRGVKRRLTIGEKLTVVAVLPDHVALNDEHGLRYTIRRGFFKPFDHKEKLA